LLIKSNDNIWKPVLVVR